MLGEHLGLDETVVKLALYEETQELLIGYTNGAIWFWDSGQQEISARIEKLPVDIRALRILQDEILVAMDSGSGLPKLWVIQR